ncbi:MAG: FtsW/RodA/SpoVE family cell cycle protein [Phycisphaerales bacterium]
MSSVGAIAWDASDDASASSRRSRLRWINPAWLMVLAGLLLTAFGVVAIATTKPELASRQVAYAFVGILAAAVAAWPDYRRLRRFTPILAAGCLFLLLVVLVPAVPEWLVRPRNGARRWINLGFTDLQPSELAKVVYVLAAAAWLRIDGEHRRLLGFAKPFVLTLVPVVLILLEPDLGTSLLFMPTLLALLWTSGSRKRHLAAVVVAAAVAVPASYPLLKPHQKARVDALLAQIEGDRRYEQDIGYQSARAMDLVGAGGIDGRGDEAAMLIRHNHLPESHNDMVFAVIACRWGVWGGGAVLGLVAATVLGALGAAWVSRDAYGRLLAVGIATMLAGQAVVNIAMTIGIAPVTGMTLPFVSFGGSSLVVTWTMVGLVLNVALRRPPSLAPRRIFEFAAEDER